MFISSSGSSCWIYILRWCWRTVGVKSGAEWRKDKILGKLNCSKILWTLHDGWHFYLGNLSLIRKLLHKMINFSNEYVFAHNLSHCIITEKAWHKRYFTTHLPLTFSHASCHSSGVVGLPLCDHWQAFTVKSWRSWKDVCVREHPDSPALLMWIH